MTLSNGVYKVEKVGAVKQTSPDIHLLSIKFYYNDETVYAFGRYEDYVQFINEEVEVEFRYDIIEGERSLVVISATVIREVITLDREEGLKLYTNDLQNVGSNIVFDNIPVGKTITRAIMFCQNAEYEDSSKSNWVKFTVIDNKRKLGYLRMFDADQSGKDYIGKWIRCDIRRTKYGMQTSEIEHWEQVDMDANPNLLIARKFVEQNINKDATLCDFINKYSLLDKMQNYTYEEGEERGSLVIRAAMEIALINETRNLVDDIDFELLIRLVIASKCYCVSTPDTTTYSRNLQSILAIREHGICKDRKLLCCLDEGVDSPYEIYEREYFLNISQAVKTLLKRKGPYELKSTLEGMARK